MSEEEGSEKAAEPAKNPEVVALKAQIAIRKEKRQAALEAKDADQLKIERRRIHRLKRKIRHVS